MFESGEEPEVCNGLSIMNELVVPCIPLLLVHDTEKDLLAVEDMRNRWCSYLGQEMEREFVWIIFNPNLKIRGLIYQESKKVIGQREQRAFSHY